MKTTVDMATLNWPEVIGKFDSVLERGLCSGVGTRAGQMCIEAAICYAAAWRQSGLRGR